MRSWFLLGVLFLVVGPRAEAQGRGPFANVSVAPTPQWVYDAIATLGEHGLLRGFPDGTPSARRPLTRYEFAVVIQRMAKEAHRAIAGLPPRERPVLVPPADTAAGALCRIIAREHRIVTPEWEVGDLIHRLAREYRTELLMLGSSPALTDAVPLRKDESDLRFPERLLSTRQKAGRKRARAEWRRAAVHLEWPGTGPNLLLVPTSPIDLRKPELMEEAAAHDEGVYRLTLKRGWPPNSARRTEVGPIWPGPGRTRP
jgi:hypothetical protein